MQFKCLLFLIFSLIFCLVTSVPINEYHRGGSLSEKRQGKQRSGYIRFGKRSHDPNAELLDLDQLLF
ncbi:unnamed protein product [Caenorhabditis angaria]|uniref:Uncharacterized protein n=1 Tax=Caenorhabditis angaria TaxID=860376 RepID=A0A9P1N2F9_9PELO|nr:unnamed protein product [Caenorhabditis angaria]